jgi:ribonuclease HI
MNSWILYADGGARGNPGPAGAGACLEDGEGNIIAEVYEYLGETTNNVAEYSALRLGLQEALKHRPAKLKIRLDSQLVVRQLDGSYRVKQPHLQELHREVSALLQRFPHYELEHIPREQNERADRLANQAMDEQLDR